MLDYPSISSIISPALALLGLLWISGAFGRVQILRPASQMSKLNYIGCPPAEATSADDEEDKHVWEVPQNLGELTVTKLLVHPIKVSRDRRYTGVRQGLMPQGLVCAELSRIIASRSEVHPRRVRSTRSHRYPPRFHTEILL